MIEPTKTESKQELEAFVAALHMELKIDKHLFTTPDFLGKMELKIDKCYFLTPEIL